MHGIGNQTYDCSIDAYYDNNHALELLLLWTGQLTLALWNITVVLRLLSLLNMPWNKNTNRNADGPHAL